MKNILGWSKWEIHPFTLLYLLLSFCVGMFEEYSLALLLVCIHEYAHYYFAKMYHFKIQKIKVLPFGAFLQLEDYGIHPIHEELIVVLAGLCTHLFIYFIVSVTTNNVYLLEMNRILFIFNLLPIYPLDGSKILLLLLATIMDYQKAIQTQIKISFFLCSIFLVVNYQPSMIPLFCYLIYQNIEYWSQYRYHIIRLLLTRKQTKQCRNVKVHKKAVFYRPYYNVYMDQGVLRNESDMIYHLIKNIEQNQ